MIIFFIIFDVNEKFNLIILDVKATTIKIRLNENYFKIDFIKSFLKDQNFFFLINNVIITLT